MLVFSIKIEVFHSHFSVVILVIIILLFNLKIVQIIQFVPVVLVNAVNKPALTLYLLIFSSSVI